MSKNIEIHITREMPEKNTQVQQQTHSPTTHSPQNQQVSRDGRLVAAASIALGKRAAMDFAGKVGDRTGQRGRQQSIDNAMQVAGTVTNLAIGAKFGPVGFGVAAAYEGYQTISRNVDITRQRNEEELRRDYYRSYAIMANRSGRTGGSL